MARRFEACHGLDQRDRDHQGMSSLGAWVAPYSDRRSAPADGKSAGMYVGGLAAYERNRLPN
jgi:hypothetical protein